jgi:hypothetical protein
VRRETPLEAVAGARLALDAAEAIRSAPKEPWRQRRTDAIAEGKRGALDGAIGMALAAGASVEAVADVAGVPVRAVEAVGRRLPG